jgi:malate dehydrogenase
MFFRSARNGYKVAVLGAAGGIGQPLSLLLKQNDAISRLALYDVANAVGVATDLSHICTPAQVTGYTREDISKALDGSDVVVIPAGVPRKPGMTRDDLFNVNAGIVKNLATAVAQSCPKAQILIISNPVNSTVPIAATVLKKAGVYDPTRLFGITTLDIVRANTFVAEALGVNPKSLDITVVGGHSGPTIVPLLSGFKLSKEQIEKLTHRIQYGGDEVVKAKDGTGSATLSMAMAASRFVNSVLCSMNGQTCTECAFVQSVVEPRATFFSSRVTFGKSGLTKIDPIPATSDYEKSLLEKCVTELKANIKKGEDFA